MRKCLLASQRHSHISCCVRLYARSVKKLKYRFIGNGHSELNLTCCIYVVDELKKLLQFFRGMVPETEDVISKPFPTFYTWAVG